MNDNEQQLLHPLVRIQINREEYESPNPTTGRALYMLANIGHHDELFREEEGVDEDQLIPRNDDTVHLHEGAHFYSQKDFKIYVNTRERLVPGPRLSFDQVAALAYPKKPDGQNITYLILYRKGPQANREGSLLEGERIRLKNGMIFDVTPTDKS